VGTAVGLNAGVRFRTEAGLDVEAVLPEVCGNSCAGLGQVSPQFESPGGQQAHFIKQIVTIHVQEFLSSSETCLKRLKIVLL